jgi:hypothetical protein
VKLAAVQALSSGTVMEVQSPLLQAASSRLPWQVEGERQTGALA